MKDKSYQNRKIISYREVGDVVHPEHMTRGEYVSFLCYKFDFKISSSWDGIERRHYRANYEPNPNHNVITREEALEFLGVSKNPYAPDGIEKRKQDRRVNKHRPRKYNERRKNSSSRREADRKNEIKYTMQYVITIIMCFTFYLVLWGIAK